MKKSLFYASVLAAALCLPPTALAREFGHSEARELVKKGEILPMKTIVAKAEKLKSGKLLEAGLREKKGIYIYKVEILDSKGIVWELKFNAKTGKLIEMEKDED